MALDPGELVIIALVIVLLFGATAIPKLARSLGRAQGEFNKAKKEFHAEAARTEGTPTPTPPGQPTEEQVRRTARDLGVDEAGKPLDEVKRLIALKLA